MNRRSSGLLLSTAIPGFVQYQLAEGLSVGTTKDYERILLQWLDWNGCMDIDVVTPIRLREYMAYMRTEYKPKRIIGDNRKKLSSKTLRNIWIGLASFFHWASDEFHFTCDVKSKGG
ncbi:MAG TPA: hypothetical protein VEC37_04795 [Bacillota bacterium]|nr:hypothetical protein [Bacillota bacterium]